VVGWDDDAVNGQRGYITTDAEVSETERQRRKRWSQQTRYEKEKAQGHQERQRRLREEGCKRRAAAEVSGLDDWEGRHSQPNGNPLVGATTAQDEEDAWHAV
jgi:hypothetical protein